MPWIKRYLSIWIAILPAISLCFYGGYLIDTYNPPLWGCLAIVLVIIHVAVAWIILSAKMTADWWD